MLSVQRLQCAAISLLLLKYNAVLSYTISVASNEVTVGQTFGVSWTSTSNDPQDVDICLNTDSDFIAIGSIQRDNLQQGNVDITLNNTISPGTYTLGIRFTGCSFLLAETDFEDFIVTAPQVTDAASHAG